MKLVVFDRMEECTEEEVQRMLPLVSTQRREQALRYKHTFGRFCCLKSWLMLQELLGLPTNGQMTEWYFNGHGKPYLSNGPYFSISHCKEGIAVVISEQEIGVDIECIRNADKNLIERTMSLSEQEQIINSICPDRVFTRLWTQKEAFVKALGVGIESFEQLQNLMSDTMLGMFETTEKDKYIYSLAVKSQIDNN